MNLNQIVIPDSEQVISIMENALMVKNKVSNLLQGKNSLEQSLVVALPDKAFNLLKVKIFKYIKELLFEILSEIKIRNLLYCMH